MSLDGRADYLLGGIPPGEINVLHRLWTEGGDESYWRRLEMVMNVYGFRYEDTPGDRKRT